MHLSDDLHIRPRTSMIKANNNVYIYIYIYIHMYIYIYINKHTNVRIQTDRLAIV